MLTDSEADVERFFKSYPIRDGTTLEMLEINISRYFCTELTDKAKENLRAILAVYKKAGVTLIIRILYDWDGKGKLYEPKELDEVIWHMSQIKAVLADFPGTVYISQGVFIGSWGEMHSSAYLDNESVTILVKKAAGMLPPGAYSAVFHFILPGREGNHGRTRPDISGDAPQDMKAHVRKYPRARGSISSASEAYMSAQKSLQYA